METGSPSPVFDVMDPGCPSRRVMQRVGDKWTPLVLTALRSGPVRFTELRKSIGGVTPKVLTQTLRSLERDGLLSRTHYPEIPPRVEYDLTDLGRSLLRPMDLLKSWAEANASQVLAAQRAYDAGP